MKTYLGLLIAGAHVASALQWVNPDPQQIVGDLGHGSVHQLRQVVRQPTQAKPVPGNKPSPKPPLSSASSTSSTQFAAPLVCFITLMFILLYYSYVLISIYSTYAKYKIALEGDDSRTFRTYVGYRFSYWFVWTENAVGKLILLVCMCIMLLGTDVYWLVSGTSIGHSFQKVTYWLMSPDGGYGEKHVGIAFIGFLTSVLGLFSFAILVTYVQDSFAQYLEVLKMGKSPVMEADHIVIVGFSSATPAIVQEICSGTIRQGGTTIAILAEQPKGNVEHELTASKLDRKGSKVVVRSGKGHVVDDLLHVSAHTCRTIVLSPDYSVPKEQRDALVLRTFLVLCAEGWPSQGRIVLVCTLQKNKPLFEQIGGAKASIVMVDPFISKLFVESSKGLGLGRTILDMFNFEGDEFYVTDVPKHLVGLSFFEASLHYPNLVIAGIFNKKNGSKCQADICADKARLLKDDDALVVYGADASHLIASQRPYTQPSGDEREVLQIARSKPARDSPERIFFLGWNESIGLTLLKLDPLLPPNSEVITFCQTSVDERESFLKKVQARWNKNFTNITKFNHFSGVLGSRSQLDALQPPIQSATRIFLLWDEHFSSQHADANTVLMMLQIRDILNNKGVDGYKVNIVTEVGDVETDSFCTRAGILDYVKVDQLRSGIITMVTLDKRLNQVFEALQGISIDSRDLEDYLPKGSSTPESLSFFDAANIMRHSRDVLLGWCRSDLGESSSTRIVRSNETVESNPHNKSESKRWIAGRDKLIVLHLSDETIEDD